MACGFQGEGGTDSRRGTPLIAEPFASHLHLHVAKPTPERVPVPVDGCDDLGLRASELDWIFIV